LFLTGRFPQEPLRAPSSAAAAGLGAGSSVESVRIVPGRLQIELRDLVLVGEAYELVVPRAFVVARMDFVWVTASPSAWCRRVAAPHAASLPTASPSSRCCRSRSPSTRSR
jgi:hypothetical protein